MTKTVTFRGGVHPPDNKKHSRVLKIEDFPIPERVYLPLSQHIGAPSTPIVAPDDFVTTGQRIADPGGVVSVPLHSSVSGTVEAITPFLHPSGTMVDTIIIKSDGNDTMHPEIRGHADIAELSPEYIVEIVRDAGIVGMGGAAFPTHIKLSPPPMVDVEYCIINGAECEPFLTSDHRVMLETPEDVVYGCRAILKALGARHGFIAIEENKHDAIETFEAYLRHQSDISVVPMKTKYPQGAEKQLIKSVLGCEVPPGKLPMDMGVVVHNIDTSCAVARAIYNGTPLISRIVTVGGGAMNYFKNYRVRIGTLIKDIIEYAGGFDITPEKLIIGGPMMGIAQHSQAVPIIKGTGAVLALSKKDISTTRGTSCIRCGRCVSACPVRLQPLKLMAASRQNDLARCEKLNISDCMECGSCSYICPAKEHPVGHIRVAKMRISAQSREDNN